MAVTSFSGFGGFLDVLDGVSAPGAASETTTTASSPPSYSKKSAKIGSGGGGRHNSSSSSDNPLIEATNRKLKCGHYTMVDGKLLKTVDVTKTCRVWTEGIVSSGVAICGLIGNLISIWVLSVPQMRNTAFNRYANLRELILQ